MTRASGLTLFQVDNGAAVEVQATAMALERSLQVLACTEDLDRAEPLIQASYEAN